MLALILNFIIVHLTKDDRKIILKYENYDMRYKRHFADEYSFQNLASKCIDTLLNAIIYIYLHLLK